MEFLKRKHFSLWIIVLLTFLTGFGYALQGVPTWICLGIKSPFIEFKSEIEVLANTSVSLNITRDEQILMHQQGLLKMGTLIKPIDLRNSTTGFVKSNLTRKIDIVPRKKGVTEHPIIEEMNKKDIELLEEEIDPNTNFPVLNSEERKFIVPMALKNTPTEIKKDQSQEFSTNIDDLKNHILMLQNMTKNDQHFQSKFVVFPSIQKNRTNTNMNRTQIISSGLFPRAEQRTSSFRPDNKFININKNNDNTFKEKITIVPQVLLLNDQTPPDDEVSDTSKTDDNKSVRVTYSRRRNFRKTTIQPILIPSTIPTITSKSSRRTSKRQRSGGGSERRNKGRRQQNCRNIESLKCQRQRRKQLQLTSSSSSSSSALLLASNSEKAINVGSSSIKTNNGSLSDQSRSDASKKNENNDRLLRSVRSHQSYHSRRNAGGSMKFGSRSTFDSQIATRDFIIPIGNSNLNTNQSLEYRENIDLDPNLCYKVGGLTYGQQKLCVLHTSIMPAISRGARSAIQECQHQFKNRRWNCSTTDDSTVFGPMTSLGSPELAFIHALAAATVTSFIARACRDGQLASCGCSRSTRPKQLHEDWTWGGCGDDLEYAYKLSQNFIDIREKERKRGARGLTSTTPKHKTEGKSPNESNKDDTSDLSSRALNDGTPVTINSDRVIYNDTQNKDEISSTLFKPEDLLELQEKITKEILNSKLQEKEMLELQEKINREILNSKVFNLEHHAMVFGGKKQHKSTGGTQSLNRMKNGVSVKARSLMNLHNNEAGRRAVLKKTRITCKCHGVSGSCSLITCWQQLSSIREIGDYLKEKYDEATEVKLNKRGRLQVKDSRYKIPTAHDLVYLDESPDWCRLNKQLQWPGTHGRVCNKTSSGLDGCAILCCGQGYNTKNIVVRERCNCKFHWCCQVKCEICVKVLEEHTCK